MQDVANREIEEKTLFSFGTKAETLFRVKTLLKESLIPKFHFFSVEEWGDSKKDILKTIQEIFAGENLAVRSSALSEDSSNNSMAGAFLSKLNVDSGNVADLELVINQVVHSMTTNHRNQVLLQLMVENVDVSGVIMTFDIAHGAPYYCIDYNDVSGDTEVITSGKGAHKSLFVYRNAPNRMIKSKRIMLFLQMARELEEICQCSALDIEFAMNKCGQLFLLQVRRITVVRN